eukprot:m.44628 g.44628  ORF g.44628 m.44628 type:complete len:423 (+) comp10128_c0_seq1:216-1484(+)
MIDTFSPCLFGAFFCSVYILFFVHDVTYSTNIQTHATVTNLRPSEDPLNENNENKIEQDDTETLIHKLDNNDESKIGEKITLYIEPARTRNSLFLSGRLLKYSTGRYRYNTVILNNRLSKNITAFRNEVCVVNPGYKVFVGHGELALRNWPGNAIWMVTGDEAGDWGLKRRDKYYGLHGPGNMFPSNNSHPHGHIILPSYAKPWFRQYYDNRQVEVFGNDVRFIPLGSRLEFPDLDIDNLTPTTNRKYVYSFMVGLTDPSRERLHNLLLADTHIAKDKAYIHVSAGWHPNANHEDYVKPDTYANVMQNSVFSLCPKGHSVEQFRLYESIEAGAIPVLENPQGLLERKMLPEFKESGILVVERWEDAPKAMNDILADKEVLQQRQNKLLTWYKKFMTMKLREIEVALESKPVPMANSICNPKT